jgi:hypothetical protein
MTLLYFHHQVLWDTYLNYKNHKLMGVSAINVIVLTPSADDKCD